MIEKLKPVRLQFLIKLLKGDGGIQLIHKRQGIDKHTCHLFLFKIQTVDRRNTNTEFLLSFDSSQIDSQSHIKHSKG